MAALTRFVLTHRRLVVVSWLALTAAAYAAIPAATAALSDRFTLPGRPGFETNEAILETYGTGLATPLVPVVTLPRGVSVDSPGVARELEVAFDRVAAAVPRARVASYASTGERAFVSADGRTTFALVHYRGEPGLDPAAVALPAAREALSGVLVRGEPIRVTGLDALRSSNEGSEGLGVLLELLVGGIGALLVLVLVFRSALALAPLLMAAMTIPVTFLLIWGVTAVAEVTSIVTFLVSLIGLGVAIDFALLIVMRWREERDRGLENVAAVRTAMERAGRAVVFSGTTVAIGLLALIAVPMPLVRSLGYGGLLIPLVSVGAAITLLPVVLASVGPWLDARRLGGSTRPERRWQAFAGWTVRWRRPVAAGSLAVLIALIVPAASLSPGDPEADALAAGGEAREALTALEDSGIGAGVLTPFQALTSAASPAALADAFATVDGIRGAVAPDGERWRRAGTALIDVLPAADGNSGPGEAALERVRETAATLPGDVRIGGSVAESRDFVDAVYGGFPLMIALIVTLTFVLLARAFRSVILPIKAIVFNLLSTGAVMGVLVLVWQQGLGSEAIWGLEATGSISPWVPLMVFAFLFGLSTDYEVFILARIRESYDQTGSTDQAVIDGIARTGKLVTSAALILFLAFVALAASPGTELKIFATGLAVGILLDATLVRALLLPAVVSILGRRSWYFPERARRVLRMRPAPVAAGEAFPPPR